MSHNLSPEALDTVLDVVLQNMRSGERKLSRILETLLPLTLLWTFTPSEEVLSWTAGL